MINLKPFGQRRSSAEQVMDRLRPKLSSVVGISCFMQLRQDIQVGGISSKSQFQYALEDANIDELDQWAEVFLKKLRSLPQLRDVASDLEAASPSIVLDVDRTKASTYGIDAESIDQTLYDAFGQRQVATLFTQSNQYHLILEVDPTFQLDEQALDSIYLRSPTFNKNVPLSTFVKLDTRMTPLTIHHLGMFPAVTLSFNLAPGVALGQAVKTINQAETALNKPNSLQTAFQGSVQVFQESLGSEPILLAGSIVVLYIVLGILYESYIHPLTVLSSLPSASLGALLALMLSGYELSVMAIIGIILLIGIAKKNAIMMVDVAIHSQRWPTAASLGHCSTNSASPRQISTAPMRRWSPEPWVKWSSNSSQCTASLVARLYRAPSMLLVVPPGPICGALIEGPTELESVEQPARSTRDATSRNIRTTGTFFCDMPFVRNMTDEWLLW